MRGSTRTFRIGAACKYTDRENRPKWWRTKLILSVLLYIYSYLDYPVR